VTSLSDTPRLQYYDVQTLEYRYISKLPVKNELIYMELCQGDNISVFLHAHLQVVYYNCIMFHKNSMSSLVGVALTRYMPPPPHFRESISWIISPFRYWTATIFLHAHLQVVYYNCVNFHKTPISRLGGVALTRYTTSPFRESLSWIISPSKF
jgi:hypothetical protein